MIAVHAVIAIGIVLVLIIWRKWDPVIALVIGSFYLGIAGGVGVQGTIEALIVGFGDIMQSVGLLIGFGVLLGALLYALGALQRLVEVLLRWFGPNRIPYALSGALTTLFSSIYVDVQVVLASPLARGAARKVGPKGLPLLSAALGVGIFSGYVFVVPGLGTLVISGQLDLSLGRYLLLGLLIGPLTSIVVPLLYKLIFLRGVSGWWKPETDEDVNEALRAQEELDGELAGDHAPKLPALWVSLLPILIPLALIAAGAIAGAIVPEEGRNALVATMADKSFANLALFIGLLGAYLLARFTIGRERTDKAVERGLNTTGQILLITGIGGSLGAIIEATTLDETLGSLFTSGGAAGSVVLTLVFAWFIAALMHFAIGSVSVAAIAAAGILAPFVGSLGIDPVVVGLAVGSGSMFAVQVNSNFFWMFQSLLGLSTQGALKTLTVATASASVFSLPLVIVLGLIV
ncbi:SLC13 family permease [Brooklawnia cerclae]|uniref:H+/gluconate symporter-like permease n=1 Tax=Brooklawnia cerclae TaxID=349934 RepID=A0ABX0SEB2_9ACTN|nr:H+/gluconate symporter-like permease [Brooklawnia cerclae]